MPTKDERIYQCPRCHERTGQQERFAVHERDTIRVIVRCTACRHRWSVITQSPDPGLEPTPAA